MNDDEANFVTLMQTFQGNFESNANSWYLAQKDAFDAWMETLTQELDIDGYVNILEEKFSGILVNGNFFTKSNHLDNTKPLDIANVYINGLKVKTIPNIPEIGDLDDVNNNDFFAYVMYDINSSLYKVFYARKISSRTPPYIQVALQNDNEIIVQLGQFKKGIHS